MDNTRKCTFSIHQLKLLNTWRLYLQVTFISKIINIVGDTIICGEKIEKRTDLPTSKYKWSNNNKQQSDIVGLEDRN